MAVSRDIEKLKKKAREAVQKEQQEKKSSYTFTPKVGSASNSFSDIPKQETPKETVKAEAPKRTFTPSPVMGNSFASLPKLTTQKTTFVPSTVMGRMTGQTKENTFSPISLNTVKQRLDAAKRNIFVPNTYITTSKVGNIIPKLSDDLAYDLKNLTVSYKGISNSSRNVTEKRNAIHELLNNNTAIFNRYKGETGADLTMPDAVDIVDKYMRTPSVPTIVGARENTFAVNPQYQMDRKEFQQTTAANFKKEYGVDMTKFKTADLEKFARENNITYYQDDDGTQGGALSIYKGFGSKLSKSKEDEFRKLFRLAQYNENRDMDPNAFEAGAANFYNSVRFGTAFNDKKFHKEVYKKRPDEYGYVIALGDDDRYTPSQLLNRINSKHPVAAQVGAGAGDLVTLTMIGGAVGEVAGGASWLANQPAWVSKAVTSGITFAAQRGLNSAGRGDSAGRVARETAIGALGGATGGVASEATGDALGKLLTDKGMRDMVIPQIARAGLAGASFSLADNASTYYLHPKDERPTLADMAKNAGVAFAFGSISYAKDTWKTKGQSKAALDTIDSVLTGEYDAMLQAAVKGDRAEVTKRAYRVIESAEQIEKLLNGEKVEVYANNREVYPDPIMTIEDASFVGEANRVKLMKDDLKIIKDRVTDYLSASGDNLRTQASGDSVPDIGSGQNLVETGLKRDTQTGANKYAARMQSKLDNGNNLSDWNIGQQMRKNEAAIAEEESRRNFLEKYTGYKIADVDHIDIGDGRNANGAINDQAREISIADDRTTSFIETADHEALGHRTADLAPTEFNKYKNYVNSVINITNKATAQNLTNGDLEEIGALTAELFKPTTAQLTRIANGDTTIIDRAMNGIDAAQAWVKDLLGNKVQTRFGAQMTNREFNKARKMLQDAVRAGAQVDNTARADEVRHSIVTLDNGKEYVEASRKVITGNNVSNWRRSITSYFKQMLKNGSFDVKATDGTILTITKNETADKARDNYKEQNGKRVKMNDREFLVKLHAESHIDELAEISKISRSRTDNKNHSFAKNGFDYRDVYFKDFDGQYYKITLSVGKNNGIATVYNVGKIKTDRTPTGKIISRKRGQSPIASLSDTNIIPKNDGNVKHSLKENTGNQTKTDVRYSIAGENAKTANVARLSEARELDRQGLSNEQIWRRTGWAKGLEGKWKFEIDDSKARFIGKDITGSHKLSDILEHDALYEAYPELRDMEVYVTDNMDKKGTYSPELDNILLNENLSEAEKRKKLLHEVQHAIQVREGFAVGADSDTPGYRNTAGEIEARDVSARADMTAEDRQANMPDSMKPRDGVVFADRGAVYNSDDAHTPEQLKVMQEYEDAVDDGLIRYINAVKDNKTRWYYRISKVSKKMAADIKNKTGIDVTGVYNTIDRDAVIHIEHDHGAQGKSDHSMENIDDIARIGYVLDNYDNITVSNLKDSKFKNSDNTPALRVVFEKRIDGSYYVVEAIPNTGRLSVVTAYKNKAAQQVRDTQSPNANARNELADTASNNSISNNNPVVKISTKENQSKGFDSTFEDEVGNSETGGKKVSKLYENTMHKDAYTSEFINEADRRKPEFMYEGISNKETYEAAQAELAEHGADKILADLAMKNREWSADDVAKVLALVAKYQTEGNHEKAVDIYSMFRERATKAGQATQAWKILNKLTPEGQLIDFKRNADGIVEKQIKRKSKDEQRQIRAELEEAREKDSQRKNEQWYHESRYGEEGANPKDIIEKLPDLPDKEIRNPNEEQREKSFVDEVLDNHNIQHLPSDCYDAVANLLELIDRLNTKDDLINLILQQSKARKTASHVLVKKALHGENIEFLKDAAVQQVFGFIADRTPSTVASKISTIQAMKQLLNAKTVKRNILSNMAFDVTDTISTDIGSIVDAIMGVFTGHRTVGTDRGWLEKGRFRAGLGNAKQSYIDIALAVNHDSSSKYGTPTSRRTFKGRFTGGVERALSYGLTVTDEFQKGAISHSEKRAMERLKKSGFNDAEIELITEQTEKYRTFQDNTKLAQFLTGLKDIANIIGFGDKVTTSIRGKEITTHEFGVGDIICKYTSVPGNLVTRGVEYSPLGYAKALYLIGKAGYNKAHGVSMSAQTQRNIALTLARPMTGMGLIAAFYMLAKAGIFVGDRDDEEKELKNMRNAEGQQDTQMNLSAFSRWIKSGLKDSGGLQNGDVLTTIGFLEPLNTNMATGAAIAQMDGGIKKPANWVNAAGAKTFDQVLELSTMSTIRDIFNTLRYDDDAGVPEVLWAVGTSGATGFVSAIVRQTGSFTDKAARYPYREKDAPTKAMEQIKTAFPIARETVAEKITPFGEIKTNSTGNRAIDFYNSFLNPGYTNIYQTTDVSDEVYRLADQSTDALPHTPKKSFTYDKQKYTLYGKDYEKYSRLVGQNTLDSYRDIIKSDEYKGMSDEERIEALKKAADQAEKDAQAEFAGDRGKVHFRATEPQALKARNEVAQQKKDRRDSVTNSYIQQLSDNFTAANPGKDGYSVDTMMKIEPKKVKVDGKEYEVSGETANKIAAAAEDKFYDNIESFYSGDTDIDYLIGRNTKTAKYAEDANGKRVYMTGSRYNADGSKRFDETVEGKIIFKLKEAAIDAAAEEYADEITGGTASEATDNTEPTQVSFVPKSGSTRRSGGGRSSGRKRSSGSSGGGGSSGRGVTVALSDVKGTTDRFFANPNYSAMSNSSGSARFTPSLARVAKPKKFKAIEPIRMI